MKSFIGFIFKLKNVFVFSNFKFSLGPYISYLSVFLLCRTNMYPLTWGFYYFHIIREKYIKLNVPPLLNETFTWT